MALAPGLASVFTRLVRHEGFADVSFRWHGPRMRSAFLLAFGLPLVVGALTYGFAYLSGLAKFDPASISGLSWVATGSTCGYRRVLWNCGYLTRSAFRWRGRDWLARVYAAAHDPGPTFPAIIVHSLIWGMSHIPGRIFRVYAVGASRYTTTGLMLAALGFGAILAWSAFHGQYLALYFRMPPGIPSSMADLPLPRRRLLNMWIGETGILVAVTLVIAALLLRRSWSSDQLVKGKSGFKPVF